MRSLGLALVCALVMAEELPIDGLANLGLRVSDLEKARAYYTGWLGLEVAFERKDAAGQVVAAHFKVNDQQFIEVYPGLAATENVRRTHVAFLSPDIRKLHGMLISRDLAPGPVAANEDGNLEFSLRAPEGTLLKFVKYMPGSPQVRNRGKHLGPRRISTWLMHTGVIVPELVPSLAFYSEKLGFPEFWRGGPTPNELRWITFRLPGKRGDYIEFMLLATPPTRQQFGAMHHISLEVPDIQAAYRELLARGMPDEPRRKPLLGLDRHWLLNVLDADGTRTELMESRTVAPGSQLPE